MDASDTRPADSGSGLVEGRDQDLAGLLAVVARGDELAFARLYDQISGPAYGLILRVVRDPAQSEEVMQEVMLDVWRSAARFDPTLGSGTSWVMTLAHRIIVLSEGAVTGEFTPAGTTPDQLLTAALPRRSRVPVRTA